MHGLLLLAILILSTGKGVFSQSLRIGFGSCAHQDKAMPVLQAAAQQRLDYFIFLGDNIYGDSHQLDTLHAKYRKLASHPEFKELKAKTSTILSVWDDHDFGLNDSGKENPMKQEIKKLFLDFWDEPRDSERRKREGIYTAVLDSTKGIRVQFILLDTRWFRDSLRKVIRNHEDFYLPHTTSGMQILGSAQWQWLEEQLKQKADIRIIATSTQFGISHNGYEAWANFPEEQIKMLRLIEKYQVPHVLFISGDVHYAEVSKWKNTITYPIYDFTSSGITQTWPFATPNRNRLGKPIMENNFGVLEIFPDKSKINYAFYTAVGVKRMHGTLVLDELTFRK